MKFNWKGLKSNSFASGEIEADNKDEAIFKLKKDGIIITEINGGDDLKKDSKQKTKGSFFNRKIKVKEEELLLFTRKFSAMIEAGLAIVPALKMLKTQSENPQLAKIIENIVEKVNAGIPLSTALESYPDLFDNIYVNLTKAGEASGSLDIFLKKISANLEKQMKIVRALKGAMMYPMALMTVAFIVIAVMMIYVVPVFVEIFSSASIELPLPTRMIMAMSDFFRSIYMLITVAIIFASYKYITNKLKTDLQLKMKLDRKKLTMPLFGKIIENSVMARFSTVLANLISGGVSLIEAMEISKNSLTNEYIKDGLDKVKREIYSGRPFAVALREAKMFPETLCGFVEVGEETGKLNDMLATISKFYEDEFDHSVSNFSQLLEPIMISFLGVIIGFILVAMYMPIFKMGGAVGGS
jgi:type IV pilus assembly protein PilC